MRAEKESRYDARRHSRLLQMHRSPSGIADELQRKHGCEGKSQCVRELVKTGEADDPRFIVGGLGFSPHWRIPLRGCALLHFSPILPFTFPSQFSFSMALPTTSNSYGSLGDVDSGSAPHYAGQETSPLLGPKRRARSLKKWMNTEISRDRADVVLLLSYIITGLLDSASISTWGTFVSMQTGT